MSGRPDIAWSRQLARISRGQVALWALAGLVVVSAHAAAGWLVLRERPLPTVQDSAPAIMVEFAPVAMLPVAGEVSPGSDLVESQSAEAVETTELTEPVETPEIAEPVDQPDEIEPVETAELVEPVAEPDTVETVEPEPEPAGEAPAADIAEAARPSPAEPVEEPAEAAPVAEAVDPLLPVEAEPVAEPEVTAALADPVEPDETVEPLEEAAVPIPQPRPEPTPQELARQEPPRQQQTQQERPRQREQARPRQQQQAAAPSRAATRAQAAQPAPRAAAPEASSGAAPTISPQRWYSRVRSHIERRKRGAGGNRGVAQVRFSIDASGNVLSVALARSSGVGRVDEEAVSMVRRASPVPAPPPGVNRTIALEIEFRR